MDVYLSGKRVRLSPSNSIGKGGEADVFDVGGGRAVKVWKGPEHPDYAGMPAEQEAARERIDAHQAKLPAFPRGLPDRVIAPAELATDGRGGRVVGYAMRLVAGAEPLLRCADPAARRAGLGAAEVTRVLCDLHRTVSGIHRAGVIIGDFNDLNVLVKEGEAWLIDADSFQFGAFPCRVFTERFVDPLLCDPDGARPVPARPHGEASDWYAFAVMVMQSLLCVGPYGGVLKARSPSRRVAACARPLRRITVFHPDVQYPKPAIPWSTLPDELLQELHLVFERDRRGVFPRRRLEELAWARCAGCGLEHARPRCPACAAAPAGLVREVTVVRGQVTATHLFSTRGVILAAALEAGELRWLAHERGEYRREDGTVVLRGALDPALRFAIQGRVTFAGKGAAVMALAPGEAPARIDVDAVSGRPAFAANSSHHYYVTGGRLLRARQARRAAAARLLGDAAEPIGEVLAGQTRIWAGERFGFGFYRAGGLSVALVFDAERAGLNDSIRLPPLGGQLVDMEVVFDDDRAWVLFAAERAGRIAHRAVVVSAAGAILGVDEAEAGDGSWLGALTGHCAVGGSLLAATDAGIVRVEPRTGAIVEARRFPDAEPFVSSASRLFASAKGLHAVTRGEIRLLRIA
ncbi:MAG: hypothetical protein IT372_08465 [Polyangiaceae bacterium]|nr:hypothetical protein [Polyangiaceae bacterium]